MHSLMVPWNWYNYCNTTDCTIKTKWILIEHAWLSLWVCVWCVWNELRCEVVVVYTRNPSWLKYLNHSLLVDCCVWATHQPSSQASALLYSQYCMVDSEYNRENAECMGHAWHRSSTVQSGLWEQNCPLIGALLLYSLTISGIHSIFSLLAHYYTSIL